MIDQKPRDPLYPQGFEDIDNLIMKNCNYQRKIQNE